MIVLLNLCAVVVIEFLCDQWVLLSANVAKQLAFHSSTFEIVVIKLAASFRRRVKGEGTLFRCPTARTIEMTEQE